MTNELATVQDGAKDFAAGMFCSIEAETIEDRLAVYDAVSNSGPLDDMVGKTIHVQDVIIQPVEVVDNSTGEVGMRNRIVMVTPEGDAYGCTSTGVETSMRNLFAIVGVPPWNPAIALDVVKKMGRNGYKFTTLQAHRGQ